jgi:hypothetical protein
MPSIILLICQLQLPPITQNISGYGLLSYPVKCKQQTLVITASDIKYMAVNVIFMHNDQIIVTGHLYLKIIILVLKY